MVSLYLELCKCNWRSSSGEHFGSHKALAAGDNSEKGRGMEEKQGWGGGQGKKGMGRETQIYVISNVLSRLHIPGKRSKMNSYADNQSGKADRDGCFLPHM